MMTFKDLKKLVELPSYKEQRVPTVKALEVSGVPVVTEKVLENHGSINVYQNGYVIYRAHKRVTVFSLRDCVHYKYDAAEGAGHHIEEAEFDDYEWHIRLVLEGEDRIFMNYEIIQGKWMPSREDREYKEEILEGVDEAVSTLERMISEERVEELLSTLTDLQRKVVHIHLFHPPLMEKPMNQKPSLHQMEHYQKFYENGEYVRAVESTTEQNYNMIDGCANNLPKPRIINGRESVLDKLRIRQMAREKQKSGQMQEQSTDIERNRK